MEFPGGLRAGQWKQGRAAAAAPQADIFLQVNVDGGGQGASGEGGGPNPWAQNAFSGPDSECPG
eukprot:9365150-Pyramimonas_sp.AAC.1